MLEAYTTLGLPGRPDRAGQAAHRGDRGGLPRAGLAAPRQSRTLDVLSGGRAMARHRCRVELRGSRTAWACLPARLSERFERLEEALQICLQMWSDDDGPYEGKHYQLGRTLNSPQSLGQAAPSDPDRWRPVSSKTLRLVAQLRRRVQHLRLAPICAHKLDVLRRNTATT